MNKQELSELWKDAPELATHQGEFSEKFYRVVDRKVYERDQDGDWVFNGSVENSLYLIPRPAPEPLIYTTKMHDAGEQPKVGMDCQFEFDGELHNAYIGGKTKCGKLLICQDDRRVTINIDVEFLPIDQRTDTEKAIDDLSVDERYLNIGEARGLIALIKFIGKFNFKL